MGEREDARARGGIRYRTPPVDISETSKSVTLQAELPGVDKGNIEIDIDGDELTIKGERKPHDSGLKLLHGESNRSDYFRTFSLGEELDTSNVEASFKDGVLTLTLHKKPEVLPKKISIEAG